MKGLSILNFPKINHFAVALVCLLLFSSQVLSTEKASNKKQVSQYLKRTILVIHQSQSDIELIYTDAHSMAQMPLNHLGYKIKYHRLQDGLPDLSQMPHVHGILTWFLANQMKNPEVYIKWAINAISKHKKKFVVIGNPGFENDLKDKATPVAISNQFWKYLGISDTRQYYKITYDTKVSHIDESLMNYEHRLSSPLPNYKQIKKINDNTKSYLSLTKPDFQDSTSHVITSNKNGAYIVSGFSHFTQESKEGNFKKLWYINPFKFFQRAFQTTELPKPDTTTINGRRIYYSHIDGDGWRNLTELKKYQKPQQLMSADVILKEIIRKYPDLPVTVAPIVADIDPEWYGSKTALKIARETFKEANVEAGSHTYSHPLQWQFFDDINLMEKEAPFLKNYPYKKVKLTEGLAGMLKLSEYSPNTYQYTKQLSVSNSKKKLSNHYDRPRAYATKPYDNTLENKGGVDFINRLLPKGKRTEIVQWSGNTLPYVDAMKVCDEINVRNINGGDARFDREFPSYSSVSSLGRPVGDYWQVYASNSNENTYTKLWTDRFFGFQLLVRTFRNTETPRRIKPLNVYYHMYSGDKLASLNALKRNLDYVREQPLIPITTSHFAAIVDGFNSIKIKQLTDNQWQFLNRDHLQTIRFDHATFKAVDFSQSKGVVGQKHFQGSLYVYLDPAIEQPVLKIKTISQSHQASMAKQPYLIESKWLIEKYETQHKGLKIKTSGYGDGHMKFYMPDSNLNCDVTIYQKNRLLYQKNHPIEFNQLELNLKMDAIKPVMMTITCHRNQSNPFYSGFR